jgi:hypothetical protein
MEVSTLRRLCTPGAYDPPVCPPGDGWSARMEDAMLHGCVPVIVMDKVRLLAELSWFLCAQLVTCCPVEGSISGI